MPSHRLRHLPIAPVFRTTARFVGQYVLLWAVYDAATHLVAAWRLPLPANLVGLLLFLLLLGTGVVQPAMLREVTTLVTRHLPFLFVPLAVGLMAWPQLLAAHGLVLLLALLGSAAVGVVAAGTVAQFLDRRVS